MVRGEQEIRVQEREVGDARWVSWAVARELVTFEECRGLVEFVGGELNKAAEEGGVLDEGVRGDGLR